MAATFFLSVLFGVSVIWFFIRLIQHRRFYKDLPKPPHSFIWGHLKLFGDVMKLFPSNTALSVYYTTIAQKYELRDIFYLDLWPLGPPQMVLVAPNAADQVTVVKSYPHHDEVPRFVGSLLGENSLPATDGEMWRMLHRMIAPGFRPSYLRSMMPVTAEQTIGSFLPALTAYASSGEEFPMEKVAAQLIFSIMTRMIMGGSLSKQNQNEMLQDIDLILDYAQSIAIASGTNPAKKWFKGWMKRQAAQRIDGFLRSFIEERHLAHINGSLDSSQGTNVLDLMISELNSQSPGKLDTASVQLLIDNIKALLVGGYATSTDTLCFVFIMLSFHPNVMARLRQEHSQVFDADLVKTQEILRTSPYKTNELLYTTAVIKETLRLFPVGFSARKASPGTDILQYKGKSYPTTNQMVIPCTHAIHYDPEVFPQPSSFDPERFLEPNKVPRDAWRPFERGSRACLGQELAMEELRVILLLTARAFDLECASVEPRDTPRAPFTDMDLLMGDLAFQEMALSAKPRGGAMMKVTFAN